MYKEDFAALVMEIEEDIREMTLKVKELEFQIADLTTAKSYLQEKMNSSKWSRENCPICRGTGQEEIRLSFDNNDFGHRDCIWCEE
jgi:hypothetical protein